MKNVKFMKVLLLVFLFIPALYFSSCKNFLSGDTLKQDIQNLIEEESAAQLDIYILADADTGSVAPNGIIQQKVGKPFSIIFSESGEYQFLYWEVIDHDSKEKIDNIIKIEDPKNPETKFTITKEVSNLHIHPVCTQRPYIDRKVPENKDEGVPRDSSIIITFNNNISKDNDFSKITITSGGVSVRDCYKKEPVINENILTFAADPANLIEVSAKTKTIRVTIPSDFYYVENGTNVLLGKDYSWDFKINNTTEAKTEITYSVSKEKGSITPCGTFKYNLGEKIKLKYEPSDDYLFNKWNILDSDGNPVSEDILTIEEIDQEATSLTVNNSANGISVTPNVIQIPNVKSITPENIITGVNCYSPIKIIFNMPMERSQLDNTFANIQIIDNVGLNICDDYFYLPVLLEDDKTLIIRPKEDKIKELVQQSVLTKITVSLKEGLRSQNPTSQVSSKYTYSYIINNTLPVSKPVITSVTAYKNAELQTTLSRSKFNTSEWTESDFSKNLINNSVYLTCNGVEENIPITKVLVTETLVAETDGSPVTPEIIITSNQEAETVSFTTDFDKTYSSNVFKYSLSTKKEGVIKLSVRLMDVENNISENSIDYYVITNTKLRAKPYLIFGKYDASTGNTDNQYKNILRMADSNGIDNVTINKICNLKEEYYNGYYKNFNYKIMYYDEGETSKKLLLEQKNISNNDGIIDLTEYTFTRNCNKDTTVELYIEDEFSNTYSTSYVIPKSSSIFYISKNSDFKMPSFWQKTITSLTAQHTLQEFVFYRKANSEEDFKRAYNTNVLEKNTKYEVCISNYAYINYEKYETYGCVKEIKIIEYDDSGNLKAIEPSCGKENITWPELTVHDYDLNTTTSDGLVKCYMDFDFTNATQDVNYGFYVYSTGYNYINDYKEFYVKAGNKYWIYCKALDSNGIELTGHPYSAYINLENIDVTGPNFKLQVNSGYPNLSGSFRPDGYSIGLNSSLLNDTSGINNKLYYTVKENSYNDLTSLLPIDDEILSNKNEFSITLPLSLKTDENEEEYFFLPYDSPKNTYYTNFITAYDKKDNSTTLVANKSMSTIVDNYMPSVSMSKLDISDTEKYIEYTISLADTSKKIGNEMYSIFNGTEWKDYYAGGSRGYSYRVSLYLEDNYHSFVKFYTYYESEGIKHFYKTRYVHPDYCSNSERKCTKKNMIEGVNGYQIYTDKPALLQVLYSKGTYEDDPYMWSTKALEADVRVISTDSTYTLTEEILKKIPPENNYCVVLHFVDGQSIMSSIKTKK